MEPDLLRGESRKSEACAGSDLFCADELFHGVCGAWIWDRACAASGGEYAGFCVDCRRGYSSVDHDVCAVLHVSVEQEFLVECAFISVERADFALDVGEGADHVRYEEGGVAWDELFAHDGAEFDCEILDAEQY